MNKWMQITLLLLVCCGLITGCDWNPFGIPDEFDIELNTSSELGPDTLARVDAINRTLATGAEIGPETRELLKQLVGDFNETLGNGVGLNEATLQRLDVLLRQVEDGVKIGLTDDTLDRVDDLIGVIEDAPDQWESSITEIITVLEQSAGTVAGEMAVEVKGVMQEARRNTQELMLSGGVEFRCNVDFMKTRAGDTFDDFVGRTLIGRLRNIISGHDPATEIPLPWVCQILPDRILLEKDGGAYTTQEPVITIAGYNYVNANLPTAYVEDETSHRLEEFQLYPSRSSPYVIHLNLQRLDFSSVPPRSRIVIAWPNTDDTSTLTMLLPDEEEQQAQLTIRAAHTDIYEGPGDNYEVLGTADRDAIYLVLGRNGDSSWWQIDYGGKEAWVAHRAVERSDNLPVAVANIPTPPPAAVFTASPRRGIAPLTVNFSNSSVGTSYEWDFGDGGKSTLREPNHTYNSAGKYTVELTARNSAGRDSEEKQQYIQVGQQLPVAAFRAFTVSGTAPLTVRFENLSTDGTSFSWSFGDNSAYNGPEMNPTHTYEKAGIFTVELTARNDSGSDKETRTNYISVEQPLPIADFSVSPSSGGQAPLTVQFTNQSTGSPTQYYWNFGDGRYSNEANPTHVYPVLGSYDVTLTAANGRGSDSETKRSYIPVSAPASTHTIQISEETPSGFCPAGYMMSGIKCSGEYCDNKVLICSRYSYGQPGYTPYWSPKISEESSRNNYSRMDGFVFGLYCEHDYCDNVMLYYVITDALTNSGTCGFIPYVSEEGTAKAECDPGWFVAGARCSGEYCDNISLFCCQAR